MKLYVYSVRRAMKNGQPQFVELIPKLFAELNIKKEVTPQTIINDLYASNDDLKLNDSKDKRLLFGRLLENKKNILHSTTSISAEDLIKIVELNLSLFNNVKKHMFSQFIEHLYMAHTGMDYGLYFSIMYANNDLDFIERIKRSVNLDRMIDKKIVYYCSLNELLSVINDIDQNYHFDAPLIYICDEWQYGKIDGNCIVMNRTNDGQMMLDEFAGLVAINYPDNESLKNPELICQIPLPNETFNFFFAEYGDSFGGTYNVFNLRAKYLENKKRYLQL